MAQLRKPFILILLAAALLIPVLYVSLASATAQASAPEQGSGTFELSREVLSVKVTDDGNVKVDMISTITFSGAITGILVVPSQIILRDDGTFKLTTHSGPFVGSILGRTGTARVKFAQVEGVGPDTDGCCYVGNVELDGVDGELENFTGRIAPFSFQPDGKTYTVSAHFH